MRFNNTTAMITGAAAKVLGMANPSREMARADLSSGKAQGIELPGAGGWRRRGTELIGSLGMARSRPPLAAMSTAEQMLGIETALEREEEPTADEVQLHSFMGLELFLWADLGFYAPETLVALVAARVLVPAGLRSLRNAWMTFQNSGSVSEFLNSLENPLHEIRAPGKLGKFLLLLGVLGLGWGYGNHGVALLNGDMPITFESQRDLNRYEFYGMRNELYGLRMGNDTLEEAEAREIFAKKLKILGDSGDERSFSDLRGLLEKVYLANDGRLWENAFWHDWLFEALLTEMEKYDSDQVNDAFLDIALNPQLQLKPEDRVRAIAGVDFEALGAEEKRALRWRVVSLNPEDAQAILPYFPAEFFNEASLHSLRTAWGSHSAVALAEMRHYDTAEQLVSDMEDGSFWTAFGKSVFDVGDETVYQRIFDDGFFTESQLTRLITHQNVPDRLKLFAWQQYTADDAESDSVAARIRDVFDLELRQLDVEQDFLPWLIDAYPLEDGKMLDEPMRELLEHKYVPAEVVERIATRYDIPIETIIVIKNQGGKMAFANGTFSKEPRGEVEAFFRSVSKEPVVYLPTLHVILQWYQDQDSSWHKSELHYEMANALLYSSDDEADLLLVVRSHSMTGDKRSKDALKRMAGDLKYSEKVRTAANAALPKRSSGGGGGW